MLASRVAKPWPGAKEPGESEAGGGRRPIRPPGVPAPGEWGPRRPRRPAASAKDRAAAPRPARPASRTPGAARPPARAAVGTPSRPTGPPGPPTAGTPDAALAGAAVRVGGVLVAFLTLPLLVGQTEHKVMAHMQGRLGPMYAGGFHGWAQLIADGVKFVQKEDVTPRDADRTVFRLAPVVALVPYLLVLLVIPLGPGDLVGQPLDIGLFFVLAVVGVGRGRGADVGVGVGQQVQPARRPARRGPAARLRAAAGAGGGERGDGRRHAEPARHRRGVAAVVAALAGARAW